MFRITFCFDMFCNDGFVLEKQAVATLPVLSRTIVCNMQGLHEVLADAAQHWCGPWPPPQIDDPVCSIDYIDVGLPECPPDTVSSQLVTRLVQALGAKTEEEARRSLQKGAVSSMLWLQSAGNWALHHCQPEGPMPCAYTPLVQSLALICKAFVPACDMCLVYMLRRETCSVSMLCCVQALLTCSNRPGSITTDLCCCAAGYCMQVSCCITLVCIGHIMRCRSHIDY